MSSKEKLLASAQKNIEKGLLPKAISDYQQVVELDPRDNRHRQKLADLLSRAKMNADAIVQYDLVAKNFTETGFYLKAIAVYKQIQKLDPDRPETYSRLADLNIKQGLGGNALAEYRSLLALYEKKGQGTEAAGVLQKLAELEPDNPNWRVRMVEAYLRGGLKVKACEEAVKYIDDLLQSGAAASLPKVVERFLHHFPQERSIQVAYTRVLLQQGETAKAIHLLKELVKQDPDDPVVLDTLALTYRADGDFANERLTLKHMLKNTPNEFGLHERMLQCLLDAGETLRLLDLMERWAQGWCQAGQGELLKRWSKTLTKILPDEPRLVALIASVPSTPASVAPVESAPVPEPEVVVAQAPAEPTAPVQPAAAPSNVKTAIPAVEENVGSDAEEMSLDFLEGMGGLAGFDDQPAEEAVEPTSSEPVVAASSEQPEQELSLASVPDIAESSDDLELELELELDTGGIELAGDVEGEDLSAVTSTELSSESMAGPLEEPTFFASESTFEETEGLELTIDETGFELEVDSYDSGAPDTSELELPDATGLELEAETAAELEALSLDPGEESFAPEEEMSFGDQMPGGIELSTEPISLDLDISSENFAQDSFEQLPSGEDEPLEDLEELEVIEEIEEYVEETEVAEALPPLPEFPAEEDLPLAAAELSPSPALLDEAAFLAETLDAAGLVKNEAEIDFPEVPLPMVAEAVKVAELSGEIGTLNLGELVEELPTEQPDLRAELEEADFFLQQDLFDAAEQVCLRVLEQDPDHAEALLRLKEIEERRTAALNSTESKGGFLDLAAEILDDGALRATEDLPGLEDLDRFRFDGVFSEFKKGIESQIETDDTESHYNLGIAYKEMGLIDDAIAEFDKAMKSPDRMVDCLTLKGICLAEKGAFDLAEEVFRSGIGNPAVEDAERVSLHYEMGLLYEVWGRPADALKCFSSVAASDRIFRDVDQKLRLLREQLGTTAPDELADAGKSGKNRVTYL